MTRGIGAAATLSMLGISTDEPPQTPRLPHYILYKRTLEDRLNAGDAEGAYFLVTNSDKVVVPITTPVLGTLRSSFTHDHEVSYMLFARPDGVIDTFLKPMQYQESLGVGVFFSHAEIDPIEQQGRMFIGDYHSHPRTPDEIKSVLKQEEERGTTRPKEESRRYKKYDKKYDNTTPSVEDLQALRLHAHEECKGEPTCELILRYKTQYMLMLIGGLNNQTFKYEIHSFIPLHSTVEYGPLISLTDRGVETWDRIAGRYHDEYEKPLLWAEVRIREVGNK